MRIHASGPSGFEASGFESQRASFLEGIIDEGETGVSGSGLPPGRIQQIRSLRQEQDPQIFFGELLRLGQDFEKDLRPDLAGILYQRIAQLKNNSELRNRAQRNWRTLQGKGPLSFRLEREVPKIFHETLNLPTLLGMTAGGLVFRLGRLGILTKILPTVDSLGALGTLGARALSSGLALIPEAAAFSGTQKLSQALTGTEVDWDPKRMTQDILGTALLLGPLRLFGWQAKQLGNWVSPTGFSPSATRFVLDQLGMVTGILAGNQIQHWAGIQTPSWHRDGWLGALSTLVHFNLAGMFSHHLFGRHFDSWEKTLELRSEQLMQSPVRTPSMGFYSNLIPNPLVFETVPLGASPGEPPLSNIIHSKKLGEWYEKLKLLVEGNVHFPGRSPQPKSTPDDLSTIAEYGEKINRQFGEEIPALGNLLREETLDKRQMAQSLPRLYHALNHSRHPTFRGSYADRLTHLIISEEIRPPYGTKGLPRILQFLQQGGSIQDYEKLLSYWTQDYNLSEPLRKMTNLSSVRNLETRIERLPLSPSSHQILKLYFDKVLGSHRDSPQESQERLRFLPTLEGLLMEPKNRPLIENALGLAATSPFGTLRILHLWDVITFENHDALTAKLRELGDPQLRICGEKVQPPLWELAKNFSASQWSGYLDDPTIAKRFRMIYLRLPSLLDPKKIESRRAHRETVLNQFWRERGRRGALTPVDLIQALRLLGDPISRRVATHIEKRQYDVEILPHELFKAKLKRSLAKHPQALATIADWKASYQPPESPRGKGMVLLQQFNPDRMRRQEAIEALFDMLSSAVQEDAHYQDIPPGTKLTRGITLRVEMLGIAEQMYWEAHHGKPGLLAQSAREGGQGIAMFLRDKVEEWYYPHFSPLKEL